VRSGWKRGRLGVDQTTAMKGQVVKIPNEDREGRVDQERGLVARRSDSRW
jgi:hypothetical protein